VVARQVDAPSLAARGRKEVEAREAASGTAAEAAARPALVALVTGLESRKQEDLIVVLSCRKSWRGARRRTDLPHGRALWLGGGTVMRYGQHLHTAGAAVPTLSLDP
jgi:hypothetical protein